MMFTKVLPQCYPAFSGVISLGMVMEYNDAADRKGGGKDHNRELTTTSKQLERRWGKGHIPLGERLHINMYIATGTQKFNETYYSLLSLPAQFVPGVSCHSRAQSSHGQGW